MILSHQPKKMLTVYFYREESGREPVLDWLKKLPKVERSAIGADLQTLQYGWPIGMPLVRHIGRGLWELRRSLPSRIARLVFIIDENTIVVLHAFMKKTQKTPPQDLDLALDRLKKISI